VPQSQETTRESNQKLPNPELNPLLNPTLGNNLGRWAQAYFTSPPEKREEAVLELLRELEAENGGEDSTSGNPATPAKWSNTAEAAYLNPSLTCAECGHDNAPRQRFCGMCGSRLVFPDAAGETAGSATRDMRESVPVERPPVLNQPAEPLQVPSFGGLSLFATANPSESTSSSSDTDIQWLREKSYDATEDGSRGSATKYLVTAVGLLLLGVLFYAQWKPPAARPRASNSAPNATHAAPATQPSEPASGSQAADQHPASSDQHSSSSAENAAPSESSASNPSVQNGTPAATAHTANSPSGDKAPTAAEPPKKADSGPVRSASAVQSEKPNPPEGTASSEGANSSAGAAELAAAESFLSGKYGPRDSSQAAKLLWRAVAKGNTTAILLLSNLYLTGDGVSKSCDQAKMLLRAAAQKNRSEAANKLRELQRSGCP
jgi:hypothetical protein